MRAGKTHRKCRHRDDRGVAAVELALVLPLLVALLFGIVDFGIVLNDYQSVRAGARDAARNAVVADFDAVTACGVYASSSESVACTAKELSRLDPATVAVRIVPQGAAGVGDQITVCAAKPMTSTSGVFAPVMNDSLLKAKVTMRIEVEADPPITFWSDPAPPGHDWGWCS